MTYLHQLTFERIEILNKEIRKLLPNGFPCDDGGELDKTMEISVRDFWDISEKLGEQQNLIEALWEEERGNNGNE